jgi:hypothetical protein
MFPRCASARLLAAFAVSSCLTPAAVAQLSLAWHTIDGGGGTSSGGGLTLHGVIGQHDAGRLAAGTVECFGGFLAGGGVPSCYANCDQSSGTPPLTANDFICFTIRFAAADPWANCDQTTAQPTLTANDFICFINAYVTGCS